MDCAGTWRCDEKPKKIYCNVAMAKMIGNNNIKMAEKIEGNDEVKVDTRGAKSSWRSLFIKNEENRKKRRLANLVEGYVLVTRVGRGSLAFETWPVLKYGRSESTGKRLGIANVFLFEIKIGYFYPQTAHKSQKLIQIKWSKWKKDIGERENMYVLAAGVKVKPNTKRDADNSNTGRCDGNNH